MLLRCHVGRHFAASKALHMAATIMYNGFHEPTAISAAVDLCNYIDAIEIADSSSSSSSTERRNSSSSSIFGREHERKQLEALLGQRPTSMHVILGPRNCGKSTFIQD
jgi:hypothetical protein